MLIDEFSKSQEDNFVYISVPELISPTLEEHVIPPPDVQPAPNDLPFRPVVIPPLGRHTEDEIADDLRVASSSDSIARRSDRLNKGVPGPRFDGSVFSGYKHYALSNSPSALC